MEHETEKYTYKYKNSRLNNGSCTWEYSGKTLYSLMLTEYFYVKLRSRRAYRSRIYSIGLWFQVDKAGLKYI